MSDAHGGACVSFLGCAPRRETAVSLAGLGHAQLLPEYWHQLPQAEHENL